MNDYTKKQPSSRTCFVCGRDNDFGLKMKWYNDFEKGQIEGKITIPEKFNGYPGVVHGGILAAILDETSVRAIMIDKKQDALFVTLKLNITYRKFTPTDTPLTAVGWLNSTGSRSMKVAAEIRLPDGTVTAECNAVVVRPPEEINKAWEPEKPYWYVDEDTKTD